MRTLLFTACVVGLLTSPLAAHGGQYKGPGDAGTGSSSGGGKAAPPTNPGGAAAPGPGAPSGSAPGSGSGATTGSSGRNQSGRKNTTSAGQIDLGRGYEIWEFWWENNKDAFLELKSRLIKSSNVSGSVGSLTGRGRKTDTAGTSRRPSQTAVKSEIIPPLLELLKTSSNRDILDSAVLALGRTALDDTDQTVLDAALPLLAHAEISVQSSTTLALGVLGSAKAVPTLQHLLANDSEGRRLSGGSDVSWLVRSFAALSLGLVNAPDSVGTLIDVLDTLHDSEKDIKVCAVVALGLMGTNPERDRAVKYLTDKIADRKLDPIIKSYIPTSLGKLGARGDAVKALHDVFTEKDTDNFVLQSAAIGLGRLASVTDTKVIESLVDYIAEGSDMQTRHFAFISLAKIGAADEAAQDHAEAHEQLVQLFTRQIADPEPKTNRSWAALAGAIYARARTEHQPVMIERLSEAYGDEKDPSYKAAFAISLGLLQSQGMAETIYKDFQAEKDPDFQGYAAVTLGLMNYTDAAEALRQKCNNKTINPTFRLQVATGLGLMSDTEAVNVLIETLASAQTLGVSSAVAKALGLIGDTSSIAPLSGMAADNSKEELTRAFACVALGIVGEKTDLPWNSAISADNNYRARVQAIDEVLDIL